MKKNNSKNMKDKQALSRINLSQENWISMFNAFDHPAMLLDYEHNILFANSATCQATQMQMKSMVGKKCYEIFHGTNEPVKTCPMQIFLNQQTKNKTGAEVEALGRYFQVDCSPVVMNEEENPKILHIAVDITKRIQKHKLSQDFNNLTSYLLGSDSLEKKLQNTTDKLVDIVGIAFARIWIVRKGDTCTTDCRFGANNLLNNNCKMNTDCLHLVASSGVYKNLNGSRRRIPLGQFKIGKLALSNHLKIISNDIQNDPHIEDREWAKQQGLTAFAGFKFCSKDNSTLGIMALFSKREFTPDEVLLLESLSHNLAQVLLTDKSDYLSSKNEKKYRELYDYAPVGYHQVNKNGIIANVNNTELEMLGYSRDEMIGKAVWDFTVNKESKQRVLDKLAGKQSQIKPVRTLYTCKNGSIIPVLVNDRLLYDDKGNIRGIFSTIQNISSQIKLEEELKESESKFRSIAETATDAFVMINPDGIITYWNSAATQIFGYNIAEIIGQPVEILLPQSQRKLMPEFIEKIKSKAKSNYVGKLIEITGLRKSKEEFPVEISLSVLTVNNQLFISSIIRDISQRKLLEKQLRQSQKMEAVGTLAGGIAHDFNNILGAIMGYTELALDVVDPNTITHRNLGKLLISAHRAKDLVKQILLYSRMDEIEVKPINVHDVVIETLNLIRASIPAYIEIVKNISTGNTYILADTSQIHQILLNLCNNAAQAIGEKPGKIIISLSNYKLEKPTSGLPKNLSGACVKLSVRDTGCGINQALLDKIFDPFFTTKDVGEGTGLGLSVIKGLVDKMKGSISVESKVGKGTTFTILLPEVNREKNIELKNENIIKKGSERILYVDDEVDLVEIAISKFESLGYSITGMTNSSKALEIFIKNPDEYDIVITDQAMPDLTGKELLTAILNIRPNIPIIQCTGYSKLMDEQTALELGVKKFLYKPVNMNDLVKAVRDVLDAEKAEPSE